MRQSKRVYVRQEMTQMSEFELDTYIKEGFAIQNVSSFPQHKHSHDP